MKTRVLVVEDEAAISEPLAGHLEREGFEPEMASSLAETRDALRRSAPDFILLDVMLPDGDGRDLCREIRKGSDVPIIMLTARGEEVDRIVGLELGADDYVVKPFSASELVARIRAILRRGQGTARRGPLEIGAITLDPGARTVSKNGEAVELAAKEFDLLHLLMSSGGHGLATRAHHGRGLGSALVRADQDARRPRLVAPEEAGGRSREPPLHHHGPRRRVPIRGAR